MREMSEANVATMIRPNAPGVDSNTAVHFLLSIARKRECNNQISYCASGAVPTTLERFFPPPLDPLKAPKISRARLTVLAMIRVSVPA